jgi:hypothetical protein
VLEGPTNQVIGRCLSLKYERAFSVFLAMFLEENLAYRMPLTHLL